MRRSIIAVLAAVALGTSAVTAAVAAPHGGGGGGGHMGGGGAHMSGGFGGGGSHIGGFSGGIARGGIGAGVDRFSPMRSAAPNNFAASPARAGHGTSYAWRGDHGRGHHRGFFFGPSYYSGLYAYDGAYCDNGWPYYYNYNSCYDSDWND
jgi:hypothetical protein